MRVKVMILKSIDQKIRRAFSDSALQYEALTSLHKEIGRELTHKIPDVSFSKILDIGMGSGWFTNRLKTLFPDSLVVGLDFADGMVDAARKYTEGFRIIQADASALPFKEASFDLITSNLAYQWVEDLPMAFERSYAVLGKEGILSLTMFGYETLQELFEALEYSTEENSLQPGSFGPVRRLAKCEEIEEALESAGFEEVNVNSERIKVRFPDMMGLVQWTKNIGANNLEKNIYVGKDFLLRANDYYNEHFRDSFGITATFEVVWASGRKK